MTGEEKVLWELSEIRDLRSLRFAAVQTIAKRLIHADDASFSHADCLNKTATWDSIRPLPGESDRMQLCSRHFDLHPLLQRHRVPGSPTALRLSDVSTLRQFERNPLYEGLYQPIGMKYHLQSRLNNGPSLQMITLHRSTRDFSNREVGIVQSILPLVGMLIKIATERELLRQALATDRPERGVILLEDDQDVFAWANPRGLQQLSRFFAWIPQVDLPPKISAWLNSPNLPLVQSTAQRRLKITLVRKDHQRLLLCDELPPESSPQLLQKLGLTPRQAEVLFWISRGKTNPEIGIILGASVHTINRHVEAIFERLSVESRSAAMFVALEVLGI